MAQCRRLKVDGALCYELSGKSDSQCDTFDLLRITKTHFSPDLPQITVSRSRQNVIRGLHCSPYRKVVCCPTGRAFDVCVDLRPGSPTFLQHDFVWLDRHTQIVIPPYCAHGFFAAEDDTAIVYLQEGCFNAALDFSAKYDDPRLGIQWPQPIGSDEYIISAKDMNNPLVTDELVRAIESRIGSAAEVMERGALTDFAVVADGGAREAAQRALEAARSSGKKAFMCSMNGSKRESLQEELYALKPRCGVLYFAEADSGFALESTANILNVVGACQANRISLSVFIGEREFECRESIVGLIEESGAKVFSSSNVEQIKECICKN